MNNLFVDNNDIAFSFPSNSAFGSGYNSVAQDMFLFSHDHIAMYVLNAINANPHISEYAKDNVEVNVLDEMIVLGGNVKTQLDMFLTLSEALQIAEADSVVNRMEILDLDNMDESTDGDQGVGEGEVETDVDEMAEGDTDEDMDGETEEEMPDTEAM